MAITIWKLETLRKPRLQPRSLRQTSPEAPLSLHSVAFASEKWSWLQTNRQVSAKPHPRHERKAASMSSGGASHEL